MDKVQALHNFWSGFGIDAIDEISSYDEDTIEKMGIEYPYISYEVATDSFGSPVSIGADIWDKSSWAQVTQKAEAIDAAIGRGGMIVPYSDGAMWITRGSPFSQRREAESGYDIRRIHININVEFISA